MDEAARTRKIFVDMTVHPIYAGNLRAVSIFASTVNREDDWFSTAMARRRPDGSAAVRVMKFKLLVCPKCEARGKFRCRHQLFRMPHWMDNEKQRDIELISGKTASNEMYGDVHTDRTPAFVGKEVLRVFSDFYTPSASRPPRLGGIGIDANQGGALANTAMVSWVLDPTTHKIVVRTYCHSVSNPADSCASVYKRNASAKYSADVMPSVPGRNRATVTCARSSKNLRPPTRAGIIGCEGCVVLMLACMSGYLDAMAKYRARPITLVRGSASRITRM